MPTRYPHARRDLRPQTNARPRGPRGTQAPDTAPGVRHAVRETSPGGNARHTNRSQQTLHENNPGRTANEICMRKPTSLDTCLAEAEARDGGHSPRSERSLRRLRGGNVTFNASVSMIQPNTSRCVSQFVILLVDKRGGSDTPRSPNKRKWSDANDCTALKQRRPSGYHCNSTRIPSST